MLLYGGNDKGPLPGYKLRIPQRGLGCLQLRSTTTSPEQPLRDCFEVWHFKVLTLKSGVSQN